MSDWFIRMQHFTYNHNSYYIDRAYVFEQAINWNLGPVFDKSLYSYHEPEKEAIIPMMILTPSIENVGSRLIVASTNASYLVKTLNNSKARNIEFRHNYAGFKADSLRYLSAIRMNASFPLVSSDVALPGKPQIYIMDAGLNDNTGLLTAYQFITEFKTWIEENTSGVILIRLAENRNIDYHYTSSAVAGILRPLGSIIYDWPFIQEVNYIPVIRSLHKLLPGKFETMRFSLGVPDKKISVSWHLTKYEKNLLLSSINAPENQENIMKLKKILKQ